MEDKSTIYVKRTQKDYSTSLKLQIVHEIEQAALNVTGVVRKYGIQTGSTIVSCLKKYGAFDWANQAS